MDDLHHSGRQGSSDLSMFRHCIFCSNDLGDNPVIEACPIGQRLAFDAERGRLWVVCRKCERWNLTPFEERWEALEDCERRFRGTRLRYSTDNIGLARLAPGVDLVRIGRPLRPELAAWRYGDQFGRRRRNSIITGTVVFAGVAGASLLTGPYLAALGVGAGISSRLPQLGYSLWRYNKTVVRISDPDGKPMGLTRSQLDAVELLPQSGGSGWQLRIPISTWNRPTFRAPISGQHAIDVLQRILPLINQGGGSRKTVQTAVTYLEEVPVVDERLQLLAARPVAKWWQRNLDGTEPEHRPSLARKTLAQRLALEMLLREGLEERSMRGELWLLEREWKAAEEIAAIADSLLVPDSVTERIEQERGRAGR